MKSRYLFMLFLSSALVASTFYGVDTSVLISTSTWKCLVRSGKTYAVIRGFTGNGLPDPNLVQNIKNAYAGGIQRIDIVIYPCVSCNNALTQVNLLMDLLRGQKYGLIWIAITGYNWNPTDLASYNQVFLEEVANQVFSNGGSVGIYTSYLDWSRIMTDYEYYSWCPLWYYDYDNQASFKDYKPFSNWTTPLLKQYNASSTLCGATIGLDWG